MRIATLCAAAGALFLAAPAAGAQTPFINELLASTTSTDTEFIEIAGTAGTSLADITLLVIEGDAGGGPGTIDNAVALTGSIPADGYWVAAGPETISIYGLTPDMTLENDGQFENSTFTALLVRGFSGAQGDDLDTDDDGTLDTTPWTEIVAGVGMTDGGADDRLYAADVFGPDGTFLPAGFYRAGNTPDGTMTILEFEPRPAPSATPGTANPGATSTEGGPGADGLALAVGANPARGAVAVRFALPAAGTARLAVYDVTGREVAVLLDGTQAAGAGVATLEAGRLAPGVYVVRLTAGAASAAQTISVVR